jgi:hypothetical protein
MSIAVNRRGLACSRGTSAFVRRAGGLFSGTVRFHQAGAAGAAKSLFRVFKHDVARQMKPWPTRFAKNSTRPRWTKAADRIRESEEGREMVEGHATRPCEPFDDLSIDLTRSRVR